MERIIFDCDPGHDDAVALAMLKGLERSIKTEIVIATHGNQTLDKTLVNALNLVQALSLDCPVYAGSRLPLLRDQVKAGYIHGENGLEGPIFPECKLSCSGNGIRAALDLVLSNPGEITFVSTGPWTDLAVCLKSDPSFAESLKGIVLMGGSMGFGNVTPSAEFNVYADPEAADIVFRSGVPIHLFSLDVTLKIKLNENILDKVINMPERVYKPIFIASMECYTAACKRYIHDYPAMHDPCTVAFLAKPDLFTFERRNIRVDCSSSYNYGRTCASWVCDDGLVHIAKEANVEGFWDLFYSAVSNTP